MSQVVFGGETISYEVRWSPERRTLCIEVHPDRSVLVRAPEGCDEDVILSRVQRRAAWISKQIAEFERYSPRTPPRRYLRGETHLYLGRQYRLAVRYGEPSSVCLFGGNFIVTVPDKGGPECVRELLRHWYLESARRVFSDVLDASMPRFKGQPRPRLIVRAMRSRWGSLSPVGNMTLNSSLIRAPRSCIEYVVIHELCHLLHRHHDSNFYRYLGRLMPDWEGRKRQLEAALL